MTTTPLCFVDVESTGLDPRIHQPWEVCTWLDGEDSPETLAVPHTLEFATAEALKVGGWWERRAAPRASATRGGLADRLHGVTPVGSNPSFDAQMLRGFIGCEVWHHRLIDVSQGAMWILGLDRPPGLAKAVELLRDRGFEIPEADHTAEGDVRATRAVYMALDSLRDAR